MAPDGREQGVQGHGFPEEPRRVQQWVPYARISPNLKRAVLVAEDSGFWQHEGIDFEQMKESIEVNIERLEFARGGSTITQQLAKNLYLSPSKNPVRKIREILIARRLEAELTKQRILELYLNLIEWGDGIFGCEAAARAYFRKSCAALEMTESALMAGAIINPREHSPARPSRRLLRRQQIILRRMGFKETPPATATPANVTPANATPPSDPVNETPIENPLIPKPLPFPIPPGNKTSGNGSPR